MLLLLIFFLIPILLEPFPLSSSGHALLLHEFLSKTFGIFLYEIPSYYDHLLHGPIAVVVLLFFWRTWLRILKISSKEQIKTMFVAGVIADAITVFWYEFFSVVGTSFFPLALGFFITACLLFSLVCCATKVREQPFTLWAGLLLGMTQGVALLPGISRFGTTFVVARWLGFSAQKAFIFSFLIEWPISVAGFFKGAYEMHQAQGDLSELLNLSVGLVILVAMLGAYGGFCLVQHIINQKRLWLFGYYVLFLSLVSMMLNFF